MVGFDIKIRLGVVIITTLLKIEDLESLIELLVYFLQYTLAHLIENCLFHI